MTDHMAKPPWAIILAVVVGAFGLLTLKSGGEVLFIDGAGRKAAGDYVPFVVWFNFFAGFAYISGAVGLLLWRSWVVPLAFALAICTGAVFVALGIHILMGEGYEERTIGAMTLRTVVWIGVAFTVHKKFRT